MRVPSLQPEQQVGVAAIHTNGRAPRSTAMARRRHGVDISDSFPLFFVRLSGTKILATSSLSRAGAFSEITRIPVEKPGNPAEKGRPPGPRRRARPVGPEQHPAFDRREGRVRIRQSPWLGYATFGENARRLTDENGRYGHPVHFAGALGLIRTTGFPARGSQTSFPPAANLRLNDLINSNGERAPHVLSAPGAWRFRPFGN